MSKFLGKWKGDGSSFVNFEAFAKASGKFYYHKPPLDYLTILSKHTFIHFQRVITIQIKMYTYNMCKLMKLTARAKQLFILW